MARTKKEAALTPEERLQAALVPDWEWPYKLPENWCWTRMQEIAQWGSGGTPSRKVSEYYNGDIYWVKTGELNDDYIFETEEHITQEAISHSSAKIYPTDTVVIAMYGATIGKVGILGIPAATNQACACAIVKPSTDYKYLFYYAQSQKDDFIKKGKGGAQPNISQEIIKFHQFPLPPLAEQHRIVDRIESLFAKLDEAKERAQAVLDSFEARKAAILHKAFTGELTAKWREEHGVRMESWEHHQFSDLCAIVRGGSPRPAGDPRYYDGNIPFMKVADITRNDSPYVSKVEYSIKEEGLKKTRMVEANTLLLTNSGATLGVPAITTIRTTFNDGIAAFIGLDIDSLLFYYYFWTSKTAFLRSINMGAAQPNLNTKLIGEVEIDVPQTAERVEIARVLNALLSKEQQAKEAAEAVLDQSDLMKKSILARAFRGELGTNDPSEESAVELLKKVSHMPAETKSKAKRKFVPPKIEAQIKTDLERKIIMAFIQNDTVIMPIQQLMSVSSRKFDVIETLRNLQERGILLKENDTYKLMG